MDQRLGRSATAATPDRTQVVRVGDPAPEFTLSASTGEAVSLSDYRGRRVVLIFYPLAWTPV